MGYGFGSYEPLCRTVPSYPHCNLFLRQLEKNAPQALTNEPALNIAGVGVNPHCAILRIGDHRLGNIGNIIACGLSFFFVLALIARASRRKAAVGLVEFRIFLTLYALSLVFQVLTTGSFLAQTSTALVVLTAIHLGIVAALGWALLGNAVVSLQWVEDGTISSLAPFWGLITAFFIATTYISLDTAFGWTSAFGVSNPPIAQKNIALFVLTSIWPGVAAIIYTIILVVVVVRILQEKRPMVLFIGAFLLFAVAQVIYFEVNKYICTASHAKVDGSLIATVLETASVFLLFLGWKSITEDSWEEPWYSNP